MEDALKARLIGASILIVLAVALLPELLSGPKPQASDAPGAPGKGTRTITIDLGGAVASRPAPVPRADTASVPNTVAATRPAVESPAESMAATAATSLPVEESAAAFADEPPVSAPAAGSTAPQPATQLAPPLASANAVTKPAIAPAPAQVPVTGKGGYSVQVGAFGSAAGARKLVDDLKADGLPAYLLQPAPGKKLHRVRVGPVPDQAAANKLAARLKSRGLPVAVVTDG